MDTDYRTPLAKWARVLEIFIPGYMFGKSWGIAKDITVDLYRATFPPFLINGAEYLKQILHTTNHNLQLLVATSAGAVIGFLVIAALGFLMYLVLRDRRYIDALRFTSVFTDGERVFAVRYASDAAAPSLFWREDGRERLVVSEPLDDEAADWHEVPPGCVLTIEREGGLVLSPFAPALEERTDRDRLVRPAVGRHSWRQQNPLRHLSA